MHFWSWVAVSYEENANLAMKSTTTIMWDPELGDWKGGFDILLKPSTTQIHKVAVPSLSSRGQPIPSNLEFLQWSEGSFYFLFELIFEN